MRAEIVLMSGLSFCLGLAIGLIIHLPAVQSPVDSRSDGHKNIHSLTRRFILGLKPQQESPEIKIVTNNNINIRGYENKQIGVHKNNKLSKHGTLESRGNGAQSSIQMAIESPLSEKEPAVVKHVEQTAQGANDVIDTSINKRELQSNPNKPSEFVTTDEDSNEIREGVIGVDGGGVQYSRSQMSNITNISHWIKGVYFTQEVEGNTPGFTDLHIAQWRLKVNHEKVVSIKEGCGRMQNRKITYSDGSQACARYRINIDQMQGEIYSFYLSLLLQIPNVPPSVVVNVKPHNPQWEGVGKDIVRAQWNPDRPLIVTPWVPNLLPAFIPRELREEPRSLLPREDLQKGRDLSDITELAQWSDLIVFDYLTANVDRVVNNLFNLQWNKDMMKNPTHNLGKSSKSRQLVFLDNESGLFHSYRLLDKYSHYHETLLQGLCVFRKSTAQNIKTLHQNVKSSTDLFKQLTKFENLNPGIPKMPAKNLDILLNRIHNVYNQILQCEKKFGT